MRSLSDCRLYGILDLGYVEPERAGDVCARMLEGGIDIIQLRAKQQPEDTILRIGEMLLSQTRAAGIPFILNDFPALAAKLGAQGVHIGQDDGPLADARVTAGPGALAGRSTHSLHQAAAAAKEGADYIGFGPLFATPTKPDYPPIGLEDIRVVHQRHPDLPIFCIGGIKLENAPRVIDAGARRLVIVSGILQANDIARYVREATSLLQSGA